MIYLHILLACLSIIVTGKTMFSPGVRSIVFSVVSIVLTLGSGALLAAVDHTVIARVCMAGLLYLVCESAGIGYSLVRLRKTNTAQRSEI